MLALSDKWLWDFWLAQDGATWHMFFLQADKSLGNPDLRHWHVSIGHATSGNLHDWQRIGDGLALDIDANIYEEFSPGFWHDRAFRDPWVMRDPDGDGWLMFFTARVTAGEEANSRGAIGLATSRDLYHWQLQPAVYAGGDFGQLEVPQVQKIGDKWYCLFATTGNYWSSRYAASYAAPDVGGTHYLVADHPKGPWHVAEGTFLDGAPHCPRYSGKIVDTGTGHVFLSFENNDKNGKFIGTINDPRPIKIAPDGRIIFSAP